jgi:hypothetical protein
LEFDKDMDFKAIELSLIRLSSGHHGSLYFHPQEASHSRLANTRHPFFPPYFDLCFDRQTTQTENDSLLPMGVDSLLRISIIASSSQSYCSLFRLYFSSPYALDEFFEFLPEQLALYGSYLQVGRQI